MRKSGQDREVIQTKEKRIRDTMLRFRVTPEEREAIEQKMEEYGTDNMAAYLRKMAIDGYVIRLELPEIGALTGQLGKVGSNINQIARRVNGMGHVGIEEIRLARKALEEMSDPDQEIFLRHYYYYQTTAQIASELQMNINTVQSKLRRGRETLRQKLIQGGEFDG